ncbi:MAG TPA: hypothetical protein PKE35_04065 [Anaerolineales bacterium]|nr:hypothetical protein [Anaerolineales bacterium]HMX73402.1 hypothetical protein [Anaerolineales bacterium]HNA53517.1 hypothetical protein [Anaerolineales bacterium]HNC88038.1 hypothetical protein [Anaerolineales bacterium]HND92936.1 hypothetical protein [Anaerolineales bacterium]
MKKAFGFLSNEIFLGTMIALLSAFTAIASYQGAMSDSEQNKYEILGMQTLNDGNAEYLRANQDITQDYNYFDNWYINAGERPEIAEYYQTSFSEQLAAAIERDPETVWDEQYYTDMYTEATVLWDESDTNFDLASQWDERGDQLQLVMLIMALGLALAAWASLLGAESTMRTLFSLFGLLAFIAGLFIYLTMVPTVG